MGEKIQNQPLLYAVCQVIFNTILEMNNFIPAFQEHIRKNFPIFKENSYAISSDVNISKVQDLKPQIRTNWNFIDIKNTSGYILNVNSLIFHTTEYDSYESMEENFIDGVQILNNIVNLSFAERSGLRYINAVPFNERTKDYFHKSLLGMTDIGYDYHNSSTVTSLKIDENTSVKIQSFRSKAGPALPNDISFDLDIKKISEQETIMLDFDCIHKYNREEKIDIEVIKKSIENQHNVIDKVFNSSINTLCF